MSLLMLVGIQKCFEKKKTKTKLSFELLILNDYKAHCTFFKIDLGFTSYWTGRHQLAATTLCAPTTAVLNTIQTNASLLSARDTTDIRLPLDRLQDEC